VITPFWGRLRKFFVYPFSSWSSAAPSAKQNLEGTCVASQVAELLNAVSLLVQAGQLDKAIQQIEMSVRVTQIDNLDLSECYMGLLRARKNHSKFMTYAPHHMHLLAKSGAKSKAMALYIECVRLDNSFVPQALVLFKIAGWLDETGKNKEAIYALNCLIKCYPQNDMVPKALYRAAQIFHERIKDVERSKKILTELIHKFPDHEIAAFAKNYLKGLHNRSKWAPTLRKYHGK
jgi:tetratricopeptide (TPR) repeat protein